MISLSEHVAKVMNTELEQTKREQFTGNYIHCLTKNKSVSVSKWVLLWHLPSSVMLIKFGYINILRKVHFYTNPLKFTTRYLC